MTDNENNLIADNIFNKQEFSKIDFTCSAFPKINGKIYIAMFAKSGRLKMGANVIINSGFEANPIGGVRTCFYFKGDNALIEIGDGTGISNSIMAAKSYIKIGNQVYLGGGVKIFDTDFHSADFEERMSDIKIPTAPVVIGNGVFIGADSVILKGVNIGEYSVVGACSLVTKNIPPGEIWGGNPAKFIKKIH